MPDIYSSISQQPIEIQERVVNAMRLRADEPEMQEMLKRYLAKIEVPERARVLEIGCGAGPATRVIAGLTGVAHVIGVDPSPVFLESARSASKGILNITFAEGDARSLAYDDESFEIVLSHTTLCHVPEPEKALHEAYRVLSPRGQLVVFDGDYATMSLAIGDFDPIQPCVDAFLENFVHDKWFMRHLPKMAEKTGFEIRAMEGHGYVKITDPDYLLTVVHRGADSIAAEGTIGPDLVAALRQEAQRRAEQNEFYGSIMFASLIAEKPA